jgi:sterol 3beta-glucosyltransferase
MPGCPSVVIAYIVDQFLWGSELKQLGIGAEVLNRRTVTSKKMAKQIQFVLGKKSMTENAKKIGDSLKMENGVTNAGRIIENQFLNRN